MSNDTKENKDKDTDDLAIKPAEIRLTPVDRMAAGEQEPEKPRQYRWFWASLLILLVMAIGVIFLLPRLVEPPVLTADSTATTAGNSSGASASGTDRTNGQAGTRDPASPWTEAQLAKQREESQALLAQMLKLQEELERRNVQSWAGDEYDDVLALAADGDAAYREQDFQLAISRYRNALNGMESLLDKMQVLFEKTVQQGENALRDGDSAKAGESFELALLMKPENQRALTGLQRSRTLDEVLQRITEADDLEQNGRLEEAKERYEQALALDKHAERARARLEDIKQKIADRDFNRLMSAGYRHLEEDELEQAKASFEKAGKLKPGSGEVQSALDLARSRITNQRINGILASAARAEQAEKWQDAVAEYEKALAIDANLARAQEGRDYARIRARLDERLEQAISQPARLSNKAVFEETRLLYQQASNIISSPGPRLARQLETLGKLLDYAATPVAVTLQSDNMTEVAILRVGKLGRFDSKSLSLRPGEYVAVGSRPGYRDVRVEFTVKPEHAGRIITVRAEEEIAAK